MQLPIINLNGTDRDDLLKDYLTAKRALEDGLKALSAVWPHGRDYQTGGDVQQAMREHADRCKVVRQVIAEIDTIAESLV